MAIREVPTLSVGHPSDSVAALAAALGVANDPTARYEFETSLMNFSGDQLRLLTRAVAKRPFAVSAQSAYRRAVAELVPPTPAV